MGPPVDLHAVSSSSDVLSASALDFWMGLLIRFLAVVAIALFVVEVDLPEWLTGDAGAAVGVDGEASRSEKRDGDEAEVPLVPAAVREKAEAPKAIGVLESAVMIAIYMSAAIGIVYLNAYILTRWPWAATLTMIQMLFCSVAARGCVLAGLSDPTKVGMTPRLYVTICVSARPRRRSFSSRGGRAT